MGGLCDETRRLVGWTVPGDVTPVKCLIEGRKHKSADKGLTGWGRLSPLSVTKVRRGSRYNCEVGLKVRDTQVPYVDTGDGRMKTQKVKVKVQRLVLGFPRPEKEHTLVQPGLKASRTQRPRTLGAGPGPGPERTGGTPDLETPSSHRRGDVGRSRREVAGLERLVPVRLS